MAASNDIQDPADCRMNPYPRFGVLSLNPAIDYTLWLDRPLAPGAVHGVRRETQVPGGKGVNVARLLAARGCTVTLGGLIGRGDAARFKAALAPDIDNRLTPVNAPTRRNQMLLDGRHEYKLNRSGFPDLPYDREQVRGALERTARDADVVILSGSLPDRFPSTLYAEMIESLHAEGKRVALDASGDALIAGVAAAPDAIKPNRDECEQLLGHPCRSPAALRRALFELARRVGAVAISDGPRGAWFAAGGRAWFAGSPPAQRRDSTAAGDCLLAQWCCDLFSRGLDATTAARAVAAGAAAVETSGSTCPAITRIDALTPLATVRQLRTPSS